MYLQGFEDNHRGPGGAGSVVIQELLKFTLQATEVGGGSESLRPPILDRAEGFWVTGELHKALQQHPIY